MRSCDKNIILERGIFVNLLCMELFRTICVLRNAMRRIKCKGNRTNDVLETSLEPIVKEEDAIDERERERKE